MWPSHETRPIAVSAAFFIWSSNREYQLWKSVFKNYYSWTGKAPPLSLKPTVVHKAAGAGAWRDRCWLGDRQHSSSGCAESFLALCFVTLKPGFSKDRGENGLKDVGPFQSCSVGTMGLCEFFGLFLLSTSLSTSCLHHSLPLQFIYLNPTSSVHQATLVLLSPIPTSFLAKVISWHKRALAGSWLYICFSDFDHQSVGARMCCSTKRLVSGPPLCLQRAVRWWREDVSRIESLVDDAYYQGTQLLKDMVEVHLSWCCQLKTVTLNCFDLWYLSVVEKPTNVSLCLKSL